MLPAGQLDRSLERATPRWPAIASDRRDQRCSSCVRISRGALEDIVLLQERQEKVLQRAMWRGGAIGHGRREGIGEVAGRGRQPVEGVIAIVHGQANLLEVVFGRRAVGNLANLLHGGQQERDEHGDDGDDNQQLDQREASANRVHGAFSGDRRGGDFAVAASLATRACSATTVLTAALGKEATWPKACSTSSMTRSSRSRSTGPPRVTR